MTAPDPRPHAAPTDLVTAEDVARWLLEHAEQWRRDAAADPSLGARSVRLDYGGLRALQGAHSDPHGESYVDYSQGWRPVRRVAECMEAA